MKRGQDSCGFVLFTPPSAAGGPETEATMPPHTRKAFFIWR